MISTLQAIVARLALGMLFVMSGGHALASGSLAIDTLQGEKYGFSFNHPSIEQADQRALRECGADCGVVLRFAAECAAYSADQAKGSNAYGWALGATSAAAQQRAQSECRDKGGSSCKVRAWGCDAKASAGRAPTPLATAPAAAPSPAAIKEKKDASAEFSMQGEWLVDYVSSTGYTANGTLRVTETLGNGSYRGLLVLDFTNDGRVKRVQQDASVTVRGANVTLNASNPVYLMGGGTYNPDNYALTIASGNLLRGNNADSKGAGGAVILSRK